MERRALNAVLPGSKPIIGMLHSPPLPGAPRWHGGMDAVIEHVLTDARALHEGGVDAVMLENYGDVPFHAEAVAPETIAALALLAHEVRRAIPLPLGINVLRNDARAALGIAAATGAAFMRVNVHTGAMLTDQGWIAGRAAETLRAREALQCHVAIWCDVLVKHAVAPAGLTAAAAARDCWERRLADALIVSGEATGAEADVGRLREIRAAVPDAPLLIGSGVSVANVAALLALADGAIVGSSLQRAGHAGSAVEVDRVRRLMESVHRLR